MKPASEIGQLQFDSAHIAQVRLRKAVGQITLSLQLQPNDELFKLNKDLLGILSRSYQNEQRGKQDRKDEKPNAGTQKTA